MDLTKYKNKSRILLIASPNYKLKDYLDIKYVYQKHIKKFHKRHVKLITKIDKKGFKINFIDFDGKTKKVLKGYLSWYNSNIVPIMKRVSVSSNHISGNVVINF